MTMSAVAQRTIRELERLSQSGLDTRVFRHAALQQIRRVVPVDAAFFATTDPTTLLMTSAVTDEILRPQASHFLRNEFVGDDVNQFRALARPGRIVSTLDIETNGARERSPRYRDILEPLALGDELRVALIEGGHCWGVMCLHRSRGAGCASGYCSNRSLEVLIAMSQGCWCWPPIYRLSAPTPLRSACWQRWRTSTGEARQSYRMPSMELLEACWPGRETIYPRLRRLLEYECAPPRGAGSR